MESIRISDDGTADSWRKVVEKSIRRMSIEELNALWGRLFRDNSCPWSEPFRRLVAENAGSTFYHARTIDRIQFIYCQAKGKGLWFIPGIAVGIMQTMALNAMKEIVDAR